MKTEIIEYIQTFISEYQNRDDIATCYGQPLVGFADAHHPYIKAWIINLPMALLYQFFFCGPLVRFVFRRLFPEKPAKVLAYAPVSTR